MALRSSKLRSSVSPPQSFLFLTVPRRCSRCGLFLLTLFIESVYISCMARHCCPICQYFGQCLIFSPTFIGFEETSSHWPMHFFSAFHLSPSIGKRRMTPVAFVKTTESTRFRGRVVHWSWLGFQCRGRPTNFD